MASSISYNKNILRYFSKTKCHKKFIFFSNNMSYVLKILYYSVKSYRREASHPSASDLVAFTLLVLR